MWIIKSISVIIPLVCVYGIIADVSHLKNLDQIKNEKIPVQLVSNELQVPSVVPLELPKTNKEQAYVDVVTTVVPEVITVETQHEDIPELVNVEITEKAHVATASGRSLNLAEVDPGFSRPIFNTLPNFRFGPGLNLADPVFLANFNNHQYKFRFVALPDNEYLPPVESLAENKLENEYLPPDNQYLPPQAENQESNSIENVQSDKFTVEQEVITEVPVVLETTTEEKEVKTEATVPETKPAQYKEETVITKHGTTAHKHIVVVHKAQVPEKIEIVPSSGYFYPHPKVLFLYKK